MMYLAGTIRRNSYSPVDLDVVVRCAPFVWLDSVIVAPGMRAPLGSRTTPRKEVVAFWALPFDVERANESTNAITPKRIVTFASKVNMDVRWLMTGWGSLMNCSHSVDGD